MITNSDKNSGSKSKKRKSANQGTRIVQDNNEGFIKRVIKKILALFTKPKKTDGKIQDPEKSSIQEVKVPEQEKKDEKPSVTNTSKDTSKDIYKDIISEKAANDVQPQTSDNEDEGYVSDEENDSAQLKKFGDKFLNKDKLKKPRSLREIAEESRKKSDLLKGQKFIEGDAAKNNIKKVEEGFEKNTKRKTKKALEGKIFLIRGKDNGRAAWHYILVPQDNIRALRAQRAGSNIDVTDYGKIVRSGWGENPSDEIIKQIEEEYGD